MNFFRIGVLAKFNILLVLCFATYIANAQTVGNWTFNNTLVGTAAANTTVTNASLSASIPSGAYNSGTVYYGEDGWPAGAINTNMYLEFTITPNAGYTLNLTGLDLNIRRSTTGSPTGAGPRQWSLRSSVDGYASDLGSGAIALNTTPTQTVNLGLAFQNLMTAVTFRLYGYDVFNNPGGLNRFVFDNISIKGLMILPMHFTALSGKSVDDKTSLLWTVDQSNTVQYFEIERSYNGNSFSVINKTDAIDNVNYSYTDKPSATGSTVWYRIKAVELNGSINYSDILKLQLQSSSTFSINSIVVNGSQITTLVNSSSSGNAKILLTTMDGRILTQQNVVLAKGIQSLNVKRNAGGGIQVLTFVMNNQLISRQFMN